MSHDIETRGGTSASAAAADALCAGRHLAQKGIPDAHSDDAQFGNEIHDALFSGVTEKLSPEQHSIYDGCREIETRLVTSLFGADASKAKVFRETRYWCMVDNKWEHSAKPDVVYRLGEKALVLEYKSLPGDQPGSATNMQLRDQVVLVSGTLVVKNIAAAVIQALVTYTPELCMYDAADIERAEVELFERVRKSNNPDSARTPGEVQCKFCKASSSCMEYAKYASSNLPASPISAMPVKQWTPEQRAFFCEYRAVAKKWIEMCENAMKSMLKADANAIPGWTLEEGNIIEKVSDPNTLHQRFLESGGTTEQFMACISITKTRLKEQVTEVTKLKGKKLDEKIKSMLEGITESKQNEPSLARKKGVA